MGANLLLRLQLFTIVAFLTLANFAQPPTSQVAHSQDIDRSVKPGQDFYRFANGNWLKTARHPPDKRASTFARC